MSKSHRLAWAAGFLDGDGFITIQNRTTKYKDKVYTGHYLRVGACQANIVPLEELQKLFGGSIRPKNSGPNPDNYNRKPQWMWTLSTKEASEALHQLLPFLVHKRQVALLALDFQETMQADKKSVTEELYAKRSQLKAEITAINALS